MDHGGGGVCESGARGVDTYGKGVGEGRGGDLIGEYLGSWGLFWNIFCGVVYMYGGCVFYYDSSFWKILFDVSSIAPEEVAGIEPRAL